MTLAELKELAQKATPGPWTYSIIRSWLHGARVILVISVLIASLLSLVIGPIVLANLKSPYWLLTYLIWVPYIVGSNQGA